jgi:hypothetical protein
VAYIVLAEVQKQLPQWTSYQSDGQGGEIAYHSRQYRNPKRMPLREKRLRPRHLFTINWATSGMGPYEMQWPAAYCVTSVPFYNRSIVTASADGEEGGGDVALGFFARHLAMRLGSKEIIQAEWRKLATASTERLGRAAAGKSVDLLMSLTPHRRECDKPTLDQYRVVWRSRLPDPLLMESVDLAGLRPSDRRTPLVLSVGLAWRCPRATAPAVVADLA